MHVDEKVEGDVGHPGVCQQAEIHMAGHVILAMWSYYSSPAP